MKAPGINAACRPGSVSSETIGEKPFRINALPRWGFVPKSGDSKWNYAHQRLWSKDLFHDPFDASQLSRSFTRCHFYVAVGDARPEEWNIPLRYAIRCESQGT